MSKTVHDTSVNIYGPFLKQALATYLENGFADAELRSLVQYMTAIWENATLIL